MKTIKIEVSISIGYSGCTKKDVIEIEVYDSDTEKDINEACDQALNDWMWNHIDSGWKIIEE